MSATETTTETTSEAVEPGERGRRLPPDERREQLVVCAARLFGERPYAQVSTTDIAREAGIARGLLNHYFKDKRGLYLEVVRRAVLLPELEAEIPAPSGSLRKRVAVSVGWFLDSVGHQGPTFHTVAGAEGLGRDPEVQEIIDRSDDLAARQVLRVVGVDPDDDRARAAVRAYGGMAKAAVREWTQRGTLTREQVHAMLTEVLLEVVTDVLPRLSAP